MSLLPDFVGVGAQRCATSWVSNCLNEHPDVYVPPEKELHFFNVHYARGIDWYVEQFREGHGFRLRGEYSPGYFASEEAISRMSEHVPHAKILVMLRDPLDRAESAYRLYRSSGRIQSRSFSDALSEHGFLVEYGRYAARLRMLLDKFPREQVLVHLFEDVQSDPLATIGGTYEWLGVDPSFVPPSVGKPANLSLAPWIQNRLNQSAVMRAVADSKAGTLAKRAFQGIRNARRRRSRTVTPRGDQAARKLIREALHKDTRELSAMLGRDLSTWSTF